MLVVVGATNAAAIGLGTAVLDSGLGEPLRLSLPVTLQSDEDVGCIQVRARGNDLPAVFNTRSLVVRSRGQTRIEITSAQAISEPAVGLVVSVGCSSPVAREFVLLLDPPIPSPTPAATAATRSVVEPTVPRGVPSSPPRAAGPARTDNAAAATTAVPRQARAKRPPRPRAPVASTNAPLALPRATAPSPSPSVAPQSAAKGRDRLSVVPTESQPTTSPSSPPIGATPPAVPTDAGSPAAGATPAAPTAASSEPTAANADFAVREQALRQQQDALQVQLKSLTEQITTLRAQTTALASRNQALEDSAFSPRLVWLLIALAILAILVAAWMAWRYTQLRRQVEGSPWWTGNTMQAPSAAMTEGAPSDDGLESELAPLDGGTRMADRPAAPFPGRAKSVVSSATVPSQAGLPSNVERPRSATRPQNYPPAIETDFTVSDIEAAMATVRTVSPPRKGKSEFEDSDFNPLGGPTITSPFDEPEVPVGAKRPADDEAKFVDLAIPPMPVPLKSAASPKPAEDLEPTMPLDFKLDIASEFDPLATDSHKSTVVERTDPGNFEMQALPTALDFELPSMTSIMPLSEPPEPGARHGSTALDHLFAASDTAGKLGPDTILDLDDRHGEPLSATEVDRLTGSADGDPAEGLVGATVQGRMTRFADLMNQVDETAPTEPLRAIAQLRQFVLRDENIPTLLWLRLFELYKVVDKRMVYDALAEHFARRYHRTMVGWNETLADRVPQTPLSSFRDLDREVEELWGTEAGLARMQSLLCGRDQSDAIVFNAILQRDLLDAAKIFMLDRNAPPGAGTTES